MQLVNFTTSIAIYKSVCSLSYTGMFLLTKMCGLMLANIDHTYIDRLFDLYLDRLQKKKREREKENYNLRVQQVAMYVYSLSIFSL